MLQRLNKSNDDFILMRDLLIKKTLVWPSNNRYFSRGLSCYFKSNNIHTEKYDIVFIDFHISNLFLFIDQNWLLCLVCSRIVLVTDRHLLPLANYYKNIFSQIDSVIVGTGKPEYFFDKIDLVISGKKVMPLSKTCLSPREILLLRMLTRGVKIKELADRFQLSSKTVYALRHNMLVKMNLARISDFFI